MRRIRSSLAAAALACLAGSAAPALGQATASTPREERMEDLPPGPGREETFGLCSACHAYRLVSNQGLTRQRWDETLDWMSERHSMPKLEGADRDLILGYLAAAHPPRAAAGGFRNPFAP